MKKLKLGLLILGGIMLFLEGGVVAATLTAKDIGFKSSHEEWQVDNAETALNDLYGLSKNSNNGKYFDDVVICTTNPTIAFTGIEKETTFCVLHHYAPDTSYGHTYNFVAISPKGTYYEISDNTVEITTEYNEIEKTYSVTFTSGAPNNRYTGTWQAMIGTAK